MLLVMVTLKKKKGALRKVKVQSPLCPLCFYPVVIDLLN